MRFGKMKLTFCFLAVLTFTLGCEKFQAQRNGERLPANDNTPTGIIVPGGNLPAPGGNEEIEAIPGQKTVAVVSANRALMNMINCLGTESPTEGAKAAQAVWEEKKGSFSVEGKANTVTSPMLMAQASVAAEVCVDAIRLESAMNAGERRLFPNINFNQGPSATSEQDLIDTVRRISRSCWGRNETTEERNMIVSSARSQFTGNNSEQTQRQMLFVCGAMMSSISGVEL